MARWYRIQVQWTDRVPPLREQDRLRDLLLRLDYDAPPIGDAGLDTDWRSPLVTLPCLLAILHCYGYPARGRWLLLDKWDSDEAEEEAQLAAMPWTTSTTDLFTLRGWERDLLWYWSRRFARYLSPRTAEPLVKAWGHRSRGRRRRARARVAAAA